jgi:hypothetical protein
VIEIASHTIKQFHNFGATAKKKSEAAGAKIGANMKKAISFAGTQMIKISKTKVFGKKTETSHQEEKPEHLKNELEHEVALKQSYVQVAILETQERNHLSSSITDSLDKSALPAKNEAYDIATVCLTCENLIHCDFRGNSSTPTKRQVKNSPSCPFMTQLSTKSNQAQ